ncbi:MAG: hypothetical protein DRP51_00755 [Candidatus Zixiibacteriota bacterium]|nr:MAG: hypothetical protein DRP51_00755 [candidate division Zixibacteria bacterium]
MTSQKLTKLDFLPDVDFDDILTNPILDIAARFWDNDRYDAFRICYRSMRLIDDLVDDRKSSGEKMSATELKQIKQIMREWMEAMRRRDNSDPFRRELIETLDRFKIPFWPWERLYKAMLYDLEIDGFSSLISFLRYSEGAAISPASIFMHLCGIEKTGNSYAMLKYDIRLAARPLALFSYFVHIIRDFQKDQLANLNYFANNLMARHNLTGDNLRSIAEGKPIPSSFRKLMKDYVSIIDYYRLKARKVIDSIIPLLQPKYQLSLEIIYNLYSQVFERINVESGSFTETELNPNPGEVKNRIQQIIDNFSPSLK